MFLSLLCQEVFQLLMVFESETPQIFGTQNDRFWLKLLMECGIFGYQYVKLEADGRI